MKTVIKAILPIFLVVILLTSCNSSTSAFQGNPTKAMETAFSIVWTKVAKTQTAAAPTITLTIPPLTALPSATPEATYTPSPTEDASFWENLGSLPSNISITEYPLPLGRNPIQEDGLFQFVPTQVWPVGIANTSPTPRKTTLEELGYELNDMKLYRDGQVLLDRVTHVSDIYTVLTDSGSITAFIVEVDLGDETYVIQREAINAFGGYAIYTSAPILYQGELLWARLYSDRVEIKKSDGNVIFTYTASWVANHRPNFTAWNGHWILEVDNSVIQDGEALDQKFGFQEIFNWSLVRDKPTYFFRKGSRMGISYGDRIFPIDYQDVVYGLCCGPRQNNPSMRHDNVHFFGERDGIWYYVVMEFK